MGVALSALVLLVSAKPALAAAPTVTFVEIEDSASQSVRIGFSEEVDQTTAETTTNYTLYIGATPYAANSATKSTAEVVVSFATALDALTITPGENGDTINIQNVEDDSTNTAMTAVTDRAIFAETDTDGGFYGPDVVINEVVVTPKSDWNMTANGTGDHFDINHGDGTVDANDEYIELRINTAGLDLDKTGGYYLEIYDTSYSTGLVGGSGSSSNLEAWHTSTNTVGIFDEILYAGTGEIGDTDAGDFLVLGGLKNADLGENTHIALYRGDGFVNMVSIGTFDDGYASDNATAATAADDTDESNGRDNYGTDMGWNQGDFSEQTGTPGAENAYDPPLQLFGVWPYDATHVGVDFNEPLNPATVIPANFTVTEVGVGTATVSSAFVESMGGGRFVKLTLASAMTGNAEYTVAVGAGLTDQNGGAVLAADRTRYFMGFSADTTPPEITGINQPEATRLETYFSDENGVDISGATITVTPTISVSSSWSSWDMVSLELASQPVAGTTYTVTFTGVKDWPPPGGGTNTLTTNNTITFVGRDFSTMDDGQPPYVMGTMPMDWSSEVPTNLEKIQVGFSEKMDASTITAANAVELYPYTMSSGTRGTEVTTGVTISYDADLNAAIITMTEALSASTNYEVVVKSTVADQASSTLGYEFSSFFTTAAAADSTPPYIFGTSVDGYWDAGTSKYKDVPVGEGRISVFFDSPLDPATVIDSDASGSSDNITLSTTSAGTTTYTYGEVEYDNYGWIADFVVSSVLSANTDYTLTVTTSVTDTAGNVLPAEFTRRFTTAGTDAAAPTITWADSGGSFIFLQFSEPMQQAQATNISNYTLYSDSDSGPVSAISLTDATVDYMSFDNAVEIRGLSLVSDNYFKIVVTGTIEDQSGNAVVANSSYTNQVFTMGQWQEELHVWDHYPYWGHNSVPTNISALTANFSDSLNDATVTTTTVKLYSVAADGVATEVTGDGLAVTYKADTNTIKFAPPTAGLTASTQYRWKIGTDDPSTSLKDINNNALPFPFMVEFFTASGTDSTAPTVSSITPANSATDVATGLQMIEIFFSEGMDPTTINSGTVLVAKTSEIGAGPYVSGTVDYDPYGYRMEFRPSAALVKNTEYTVKVTTDVKDAAGVAVASAISKTFTTINADDTTGPTIIWADADPWGLFVRFDEPVKEDLATATRNYTLITCASGSDLDTAGVEKSLTDKNVMYNFWDNGIFIEDLNLVAGTKFRVTVTTAVKDLAGNAVQTGTDSSSDTNFRKIESADLTYNQWEGTVFDPTFQDSSPWTTYNYPMMGDRSAPLNLQRVEVGFSEAIAINTLTTTTFRVMPVTSPGVYGTDLVATSITYDDATMTAYFNLDPTSGTANVDKVVAATEYRVLLTTGVQDSAGNAMMSFNPWDATDTTAFENFFTVAAAADTTAPTVYGSSLEQYRDCSQTDCPVVSVPLGLGAVDVKFSKSMDVNTISDMDASDAGSNIYIKKNADSSKVAGFVDYDAFDQRATFVATATLVANTPYTLVVDAGADGVTDISGNTYGETDYTLGFTTTTSADTAKPYIGHAEAEAFEVRIFFNEQIVKTEAEDINNYALESPIGTTVSLRGLSPVYEPMGNMVRISDLSLNGDSTFQVTVTGVNDIVGNAICVVADVLATDQSDDIQSGASGIDPNVPRDCNHDSNVNNTQFNQYEGYVMAHFEGFFDGIDKADYTHDQIMFDHFAGDAEVFPQMQMAGQTSMYFVNFPIRTAIPSGGTIVLRFPEGFDVTNAAAVTAFDPTDGATFNMSYSPMNYDINGPGTGQVTIASVVANNIARTVTVTTATAATQANDFISFDLSGIVNPTTPMDYGSQGYTATITTKAVDTTTLEGPIDSRPIFISSKGTGTISGTITAVDSDANETFTLRLATPNGMIEQVLVIDDDKVNTATGATLTEANGTAKYSFTGLPEGGYDVFTDPIVTMDKSSSATDYFAPGFHEMIWLADGGTETFDMTLTDSTGATYTDGWGNELTMRTLTVNITGGPASKKVMVRACGPMNFYEKEKTLDGSGAGTLTMQVPEGMYWISVDPYMPMMMFSMGPPPPPDFMPPPGVDVNVNNAQDGNETATDAIDFALTNYTADKYVTVTVQDTSGSAINGADVGIHNPSKGYGAPPVQTGMDGTATLKVPAGTYQVDVFIPGMPPLPFKSVTVGTAHNSVGNAQTITMTVGFNSSDMIEVTGQVINGTSPVSHAPVWADEIDSAGTSYLPGFVPSGTDSSGNFSVFVPSGTNWEFRSSIPGLGDTAVQQIFDITSTPPSITLSGRTDLVAITGTIKLNTNNVNRANVFAEGTGDTYFFNGTDTASDGTYTLNVEAGTYRIKVFHPDFGERVVNAALDVSDGIDEALGSTELSDGVDLVEVTINFKDSEAAALVVTEAYVDIFNPVTNEGRSDKFTGVSSGTMNIPAGTAYTVNGYMKGIGPIDAQSLDTSATQIVNIQASSAMVTITGTVNDGSNDVEGVVVDVFCPSTGFHAAERSAFDGTYTITVPVSQTYELMANKEGYQPTPPTEVVVTTGNSTSNDVTLPVADANKVITGTVYLGTAVAANIANNTTKKAFVWAETDDGDWTGAPVEADGSYTLYVNSDTWTVQAAADGYETTGDNITDVTVDSTAMTGNNFTLDAISGYTIQPANGETYDPASSKTVPSADNMASVKAPARSINSDANASDITLEIKPTTRVPIKTDTVEASGSGTATVTSSVTPIAEYAQEVTVTEPQVDGSRSTVTEISGEIEIEFDYTSYGSELVAAIEADPTLLTCQYLNEANQWETTDAVSNDTTNHILTCTTSHLSTYAPSVPSNVLAPATPSGVAVNAGNGLNTITWSVNAESDMHHYIIWETEVSEAEITTITQASCAGICTYTHSSLANGTLYGYQIMAVDDDGYTSAGSTTITATPATSEQDDPPSSSGGGVTIVVPEETPEEVEDTTPELSAEAPVTADGNVIADSTLGGQTTLTSTESVATAKVTVPADAIAVDTTVTIVEQSAAEVTASAPAPTGKSVVGSVYNMQALQGSVEISTFEEDVTLTFTYTTAQISGLSESSLKVHYWNGTQWIALASTVNLDTNTITTAVNHFTQFVIMGTPEVVSDSSLAYPNGALLNVQGNPTVWLVEDSMRHGIPSAGIFESRFRWQDIVTILSVSTLEEYTEGVNVKYPDGTLLMGSTTVYVVSDNGNKRGITSLAVFEGLGYQWTNVIAVADSELENYASGSVVDSTTSHPTGSLVNVNGTAYQIDINSQLRGIPTPSVFTTNRFKWENLVTATTADAALTIGTNLSFPDGTIIKGTDNTVYLIADGQKRGFTSANAFTSRGYQWGNIVEVTDEEVEPLTVGAVIE